MTVNADADVGFGDFMFISPSSSILISAPDFSAKNAAANDDDDCDWGDFIISSNNLSRTESLPFNNHLRFDLESVKTQPNNPSGALPLSIFGEAEKEDVGSGAVDAQFNGVNSSLLFTKQDEYLKANGSDLNELLGDLYKQTVKGNEANVICSGVDVNKAIDLISKVETLNWNGSNLSLNGSGSNVDALDFSGNSLASVKKDDNLDSNGYAFGMERKEGNLTFSRLDFGSNGSGLGLNLDSNVGNSGLVDEEEDDGWEFRAAEPKAETGVKSLKSDPSEPMSNFNMSSLSWDPLGTDANGLSSNINGVNSDGSKLNSIFVDENDDDGDDDGWEFKAAEPETRVVTCNAKGNEETLKKPKGALPLSIFGDTEIETEDPLRDEDVSILKPTTPWTGMNDTHSNISINDLISSLYSQAETNSSLNQISNPSENGLLSSQLEVDSNLVNDDNKLDDDSLEFKGVVSGARGESQNSPLGFRDSYEKYSTKTELNDYVDLYSNMTADLCFVAYSHLDNLKKDKIIAAPSGEDAEVKAIEEEIQGLYNELQKDGIISDEMALENLQSTSIYLGEYAKVILEKRFQVLESEYQLSEKLLLAEKDMVAAIELLKHAASTLKILKLGSVEDQTSYVSNWSRILSVCALELKHGATIWKQSLQKNIHGQLLSKPQGRQYILSLGEIYRVVKIVGSLSTKLYKPWILFTSENPTNFHTLVRECSTVWCAGLEEALQSLTDSTDSNYDVEALLGSIQSIHDPDAHELYKQVFYGQEPICCLSGLSAAAVSGMKMAFWDGRDYFLTIVNLWTNLISRDPPNLPHIHSKK